MTTQKKTKALVQAAVIAALYIVLTYFLAPISFGPWQFRVSEALTILPALTFAAVPGLIVGCFLSNLLNPQNLGMVDVLLGTLASGLAALVTYYLSEYLKKKVDWKKYELFLLPFPAVLFNGLIVGVYLPFLLREVFPEINLVVILANIGSIAISEALVVYTLGVLLYQSVKKIQLFSR